MGPNFLDLQYPHNIYEFIYLALHIQTDTDTCIRIKEQGQMYDGWIIQVVCPFIIIQTNFNNLNG